MAYKDSHGNIIKNKSSASKSPKRRIKEIPIEGRKVYYIGKTKATGTEIVYYQGKILSYNKDTGICLCSILDRHLIRNPQQLKVEMKIPFAVLKEDKS